MYIDGHFSIKKRWTDLMAEQLTAGQNLNIQCVVVNQVCLMSCVSYIGSDIQSCSWIHNQHGCIYCILSR